MDDAGRVQVLQAAEDLAGEGLFVNLCVYVFYSLSFVGCRCVVLVHVLFDLAREGLSFSCYLCLYALL